MQDSTAHIRQLWERYLSDTASANEVRELLTLIQNAQRESEDLAITSDILREGPDIVPEDPFVREYAWEQFLSTQQQKRIIPLHWMGWAAAAIIVFGIGTYLWKTNRHEKPLVTTQPLPIQDIMPGGDRAVLTLADGSTILLDSAANGQLAQQQGSTVIKKDGEVRYQTAKEDGNKKIDVVSYNTMSTPRGGQFQLRLPDGTKVWLNAASSITYPTIFTGRNRKVSIDGEAYFEVVKNAAMPFTAEMHNGISVEVLGTHFNINSYTDELSVRTTLLEGKVKVIRQNQSLLLEPGQQAIVKDNIALNRKVNIERAIAWKNGVFNFDDVPFDEFMRQLARWYDLTIVYKGNIPNKLLRGKLQRNLQLSQILKVLSLFEVNYTLSGKVLTIE